MLNYVRVSWRAKRLQRGDNLRRTILRDSNLSWAARGLGCFLTTTNLGVRFPNSQWDGTMGALDELMLREYIFVESIEDGNE